MLRTWRFPFTLEIEPLAGAEPSTLSAAAGPMPITGALVGECGLRAARRWRRPAVVLRPARRAGDRSSARSPIRCSAASRQTRKIFPALSLVDWSAGWADAPWRWIVCSCSSSPPAAARSRSHLNGMPLAALGPGGGSTSLAVHEYTLAGRNELTLVVGPAAPGATRTEPAARRDRPDLGAGAPGARPPGPVAGRSGGPRARRRRVGDDRGPLLRRAVGAQARGRSARQLPALALARRAADRARRRGAAGHSRVPAAARGRARPRQSRAADRRRRSCASTSWRSPTRAMPTTAVQRFRDHVQGLYAAKALKVLPPVADELVLRPLVDGRLIECLAPTGGPALRTSNEAAGARRSGVADPAGDGRRKNLCPALSAAAGGREAKRDEERWRRDQHQRDLVQRRCDLAAFRPLRRDRRQHRPGREQPARPARPGADDLAGACPGRVPQRPLRDHRSRQQSDLGQRPAARQRPGDLHPAGRRAADRRLRDAGRGRRGRPAARARSTRSPTFPGWRRRRRPAGARRRRPRRSPIRSRASAPPPHAPAAPHHGAAAGLRSGAVIPGAGRRRHSPGLGSVRARSEDRSSPQGQDFARSLGQPSAAAAAATSASMSAAAPRP